MKLLESHQRCQKATAHLSPAFCLTHVYALRHIVTTNWYKIKAHFISAFEKSSKLELNPSCAKSCRNVKRPALFSAFSVSRRSALYRTVTAKSQNTYSMGMHSRSSFDVRDTRGLFGMSFVNRSRKRNRPCLSPFSLPRA